MIVRNLMQKKRFFLLSVVRMTTQRTYSLIKLVDSGSSLSGRSTPSAFNAFSIHAMLRARVRIVCKPSASFSASPGMRPCTLFQYCDGTTGMLLIVNYLFKRSNVALAPPLRHTATAAAGLYCRCCLLEKKSLSSNAHNEPFGPA